MLFFVINCKGDKASWTANMLHSFGQFECKARPGEFGMVGETCRIDGSGKCRNSGVLRYGKK